MTTMKLPKILRPKRSSSGLEESSPCSSSSSSAAPSPKLFSPRRSSSSSPSSSKKTTITAAVTSISSVSPSRSSSSSSLIKAELEGVFRLFDSNRDGKICVSEIRAVLNCLGDPPTEDELQKMIQEVDSDGDGLISLDEFLHFHGHGAAIDTAELKAAFAVFDQDRNGFISADELHRVLVGLGEASLTMEDCGRMIRGVDCNGDGRVDFEEFRMMMTASA